MQEKAAQSTHTKRHFIKKKNKHLLMVGKAQK